MYFLLEHGIFHCYVSLPDGSICLAFFPSIFDVELMSGVSFHTYRLTRILGGLRFYKIKGGSEIDEQQMMGNDSAGSGFK